MIRHGRRLLRARAAARTSEQGEAHSSLARHHQEQPIASAAAWPPLFLLPAWTPPSNSKKTVARSATTPVPVRQSRRHASSYTYAELAPSHDVYAQEWLADQSCDPVPTASTSKAVPTSDRSKPTSSSSAQKEGSTTHTTASISRKGKAPESFEIPTAVFDPPPQTYRKARASKKSLSSALEDAHHYLQHEQGTSSLDKHDTSSIPFRGFDFPISTIPFELQTRILQLSAPPPQSIHLTQEQESLLTQRLFTRFNYMCRILDAVQHRTANTSRLSRSEETSIREVAQRLLFLDPQSTGRLLDSLSSETSRGTSNVDRRRMRRILQDTLLTYISQDLHRQSSLLPDTDNSAPSSSRQIQHKFLVKHISRSMRRLRALSSIHRQTFAALHLDAFKSLSRSILLTEAGTPSSIFQILDCLQGVEMAHLKSPNVTLQAILDLCAVPLNHAYSPSRERSLQKESTYLRDLEQSMLRAWQYTVMPVLRKHYTVSPPTADIFSALQNIHSLSLRATMPMLPSQIALDGFTVSQDCTSSPQFVQTLPLDSWRSTIDVCIRSGRTEQAEALLRMMTSSRLDNDSDNSLYWHLRLQTTLKSASEDSSSFLAKLDQLLKEIAQAHYHPDQHFLCTLLRHIPTFPTSLDKTCDLFHSALSLAQHNDLCSGSETSAPSSSAKVRLAASHGDLLLFERGKLEGVQLPWTPMIAAKRQAIAQLGMPNTPEISMEDLLSAATVASQDLRLAMLQDQSINAISAFERLTACFRSIVAWRDSNSVNQISAESYSYETAKAMWIGSLVRLLSASLQDHDLQRATHILGLALEKLGSRYVGHQAVKRVFQAACSPRFYRQPHLPSHRQGQVAYVIDWRLLEKMLSITACWAQDTLDSRTKSVKPEVDLDLTTKQRLRSVLSKNYSSKVLARATGVCIVPASFFRYTNACADNAEDSSTTDPEEVIHTVLSTMVALQANCKYTTWWEEVERKAAEKIDILQVPYRERVAWREKCENMARLCAQFEHERLTKL